jgi:hypothetical protein
MRENRKLNRINTHQRLPCRKSGSLLCVSLLILAGAALVLQFANSQSPNVAPPAAISGLLRLSAPQLAEVPILTINLLCADGLSGRETDIPTCTATLDNWAARVRSETERHQYRFERNPADFEHSAGFFRMLMLAVVLAEDFGIRYDPERQRGPSASRADDGFFSDPAMVFLSGLLGPQRKGTCSSLPVLYIAVGRQLGYPLKLVTTKGHLFVRWDGAGERFNVEATARGLVRFDDDYYRHWPFEVSRAEETADGYLRSLTAQGELAVFLSIRAMCLREQRRFGEAAQCFSNAARLAPECQSYRTMHANLVAESGRKP